MQCGAIHGTCQTMMHASCAQPCRGARATSWSAPRRRGWPTHGAAAGPRRARLRQASCGDPVCPGGAARTPRPRKRWHPCCPSGCSGRAGVTHAARCLNMRSNARLRLLYPCPCGVQALTRGLAGLRGLCLCSKRQTARDIPVQEVQRGGPEPGPQADRQPRGSHTARPGLSPGGQRGVPLPLCHGVLRRRSAPLSHACPAS